MTDQPSSDDRYRAQFTPPLPSIQLGKLNVGEDVLQALARNGQSIFPFLECHAHGDWGEVDQATRNANQRAVLHGYRIKAVYPLLDRTLIAIRTNAGRTETTVDIEEHEDENDDA